MIFADVIMPFGAIYYAWAIFFPVNILALISEMIVFKLAYRDLKARTIILGILGANAVSFLGGSIICVLVEVGLMSRKGVFYSGMDSYYLYYTFLGVFFALLLSIYIELRYWQFVYRGLGLRSMDKVCALANIASYGVLVGAAIVTTLILGTH